MGFLDFIFDNIFIVIIVAIGIINLLSRSAKSGQSEQKKRERPPSSPHAQPRRQETLSSGESEGHARGRMAKKIESTFEDIATELGQGKPQQTIEAQQQKQYEQLKQEVQNEYAEYKKTEDEKAPQSLNRQVTHKKTDHTPEIDDVNLRHLVSHKGLIQSVIMSEVLGPPRALKPYRSVIEDRRR